LKPSFAAGTPPTVSVRMVSSSVVRGRAADQEVLAHRSVAAAGGDHDLHSAVGGLRADLRDVDARRPVLVALRATEQRDNANQVERLFHDSPQLKMLVAL
jgi:hypothetical protein